MYLTIYDSDEFYLSLILMWKNAYDYFEESR